MVAISVQHDLHKIKAELSKVEREQIPFATAQALTKTAQAAQAAVKQEMSSVFDRPTPFTLNSTFVKPATKANLEAQVYLKDEGNKAGGSAKVRLEPQLVGGQRAFKRMEGALRHAGLLGNSEQAVPGAAAELDAYGNMSRGQIVQILAYFKAFPESGYKANTTQAKKDKMAKGTKTKMGVRYFLKRDGRGRGIYKATQTGFGSAIQPVLMFVRRAQYRRRLDMPGVVSRTVTREFGAWFKAAMAEALRSAR